MGDWSSRPSPSLSGIHSPRVLPPPAAPLRPAVLLPANQEQAAAYLAASGGMQRDRWKLQLLENVPAAIKDQVLLLRGDERLPQLRHRLALVLDHDRDIDVANDADARTEYAAKVRR